jgi:hypothetical protein
VTLAALPVAARAALLGVSALGLNLPFGAWRVRSRRLSLPWFLAIHVPIPFLFLLRRVFGLRWPWIALSLVCAVAAQLAGGRIWPAREGISSEGGGEA